MGIRRRVKYHRDAPPEATAVRRVSSIVGLHWRKILIEKAYPKELRLIAARLGLPIGECRDKPLLQRIILYALQERLRFLNTGELPSAKTRKNWRLLWAILKTNTEFVGMYDIWYPDLVGNPLYAAKIGKYSEEQMLRVFPLKRTPRIR